MCVLAMRLNTLPSTLEAEGPEVISTMIRLLSPADPSIVDENLAELWPMEARA